MVLLTEQDVVAGRAVEVDTTFPVPRHGPLRFEAKHNQLLWVFTVGIDVPAVRAGSGPTTLPFGVVMTQQCLVLSEFTTATE